MSPKGDVFACLGGIVAFGAKFSLFSNLRFQKYTFKKKQKNFPIYFSFDAVAFSEPKNFVIENLFRPKFCFVANFQLQKKKQNKNKTKQRSPIFSPRGSFCSYVTERWSIWVQRERFFFFFFVFEESNFSASFFSLKSSTFFVKLIVDSNKTKQNLQKFTIFVSVLVQSFTDDEGHTMFECDFLADTELSDTHTVITDRITTDPDGALPFAILEAHSMRGPNSVHYYIHLNFTRAQGSLKNLTLKNFDRQKISVKNFRSQKLKNKKVFFPTKL